MAAWNPGQSTQDREPMSIAVVIPCYQVEGFVEQVVAGIPDYIRHIILVNDASRDATPQIIDRLAAKHPRVVALHLSENQGVGGAVMRGYKEALRLGAEIAVKMDGDGQMDPSMLPDILSPLLEGRADYAKGNRFLHTRSLRSMPFVRRFGNIGLSFLAKLATGYWNLFDPTNGFTALKTSLLPLINRERIAQRYFFEISLLVELGLMRAVVADVYMPARYGDEKSSLSEWKSLVTFPPRLLSATLRRIAIQYFIRDFSAFSLFSLTGLIGLAFGTVWGVYYWLRSIRLNVAATTGTVMIAVLPVILGIQLLLQAIVLDIQNIPKEPVARRRGESPPIP